jgi:cysteine desulfurase
MRPIYLDNAATTPVAEEVRAALTPFLENEFGNPSSRHALGVHAAEAVDAARARIARAVGGRAQNVVFTSGGTESNNLAVLGAARARKRGNVVIGPTEHPSVRGAAEALAREGFELRVARLGQGGDLDLGSFEELLDDETVVVAQMLVNGEFGTLYPASSVARLVRRLSPKAHMHVDAVQGLGKVELDLNELGADTLSISAHKIHAPKGTGALVHSGDARLTPLVFGGGQQGGLRPGTENVVGAVALGAAAELADSSLERTQAVTKEVRGALLAGLARLEGAHPVEPGERRVDAVCAVELPGAPAEVWQHHLETHGICTSVGSACQSLDKDISPALMALGFDAEQARHVLRFSFSRYTTRGEVESALEALASAAPELGALS